MKNSMAIFFFALISVTSYSQKLNKLGKINIDEIPTIPNHRIEKQDGVYKIVKDSFVLDGNAYYEIPDGFIVCLQVVGDDKDFIKRYDADGKLLVSIFSDRIINLKISEKANKLVFFDTEHIIQVNLNNYHMDTLQGSFVYSFVENEELIYYNPDQHAVCFNDLKIKIEEYPNQIIDFKGEILIITKQHIYGLVGGSLFSKYDFEGQFFDAEIINDEFYFVDKTGKRKTERFSLYKTSDFSKFILVDRKDELNR